MINIEGGVPPDLQPLQQLQDIASSVVKAVYFIGIKIFRAIATQDFRTTGSTSFTRSSSSNGDVTSSRDSPESMVTEVSSAPLQTNQTKNESSQDQAFGTEGEKDRTTGSTSFTRSSSSNGDVTSSRDSPASVVTGVSSAPLQTNQTKNKNSRDQTPTPPPTGKRRGRDLVNRLRAQRENASEFQRIVRENESSQNRALGTEGEKDRTTGSTSFTRSSSSNGDVTSSRDQTPTPPPTGKISTNWIEGSKKEALRVWEFFENIEGEYNKKRMENLLNQANDSINTTRKEITSPDLVLNRIRSKWELFWSPLNVGSAARNIVAATIVPGTTASAALSAFCVLAIVGGMLLAATGAFLSIANIDSLIDAIRNVSREKIFTSFLNILVGLEALVTGIAFAAESIASQIGHVVAAGAAGAVIPWAALALYVTLIFSAIYKIGVGLKFRFELQDKLNGAQDKDKLLNTLKWLREKTEVSQADVKAFPQEDLDKASLSEKISASLHTKWDEFIFRTGKEVFQVVDREKLNDLIAKLEKNDLTVIDDAKNLTQTILESNAKMLKWTGISLVSALIGLAGVSVCLASVGHIASIVSSVLFALAAFISILTDSPTIREKLEKGLASIQNKVTSIKVSALMERFFAKEEKTLTPVADQLADMLKENELRKKQQM